MRRVVAQSRDRDAVRVQARSRLACCHEPIPPLALRRNAITPMAGIHAQRKKTPPPPRRRHRPGSHGRGETAPRLLRQDRDRQVRPRGGAGRRLLLRRAQGRRSPTRRWRRRTPPMRSSSALSAGRNGTTYPTTCGPRPACCGCARTSDCSPISARRSAYPALADILEPQARGGRGARHHHPARTDRRRLFRRAEDHHRPRQRAEARRSTRRSTTPTRSSASRASASSLRASGATRSPRWRSAT